MPQTSFSTLIIELRQNTRLRVGIWLIVALLLSYLTLLFNDYNAQIKQDYHNALTRFNQLQTLSQQTFWLERANQAQTLRTQLETRLWQADTKGLAQATFQKWLKTQADRATLENVRLQVEPALDVPHHSHLWQVTARLQARFTPNSLNMLLLAIAKQLQLTVIERLEVRQNQPRITVIIHAYFQAPITSS